jgi:predicted DNA-binding transcriptional regulator YafY
VQRARQPAAHATGELLKFGPDLEVIEPVELRAALRRASREMTALYDSDPPLAG